MKKVYLAVCLMCTLILLYFGNYWVQAQKQAQPPAAPTGRVAVVNLDQLIKNHPKYESVQDEIKEAALRNDNKLKDLTKKLDALLSDFVKAKKTKNPDAIEAAKKAFDDLQAEIKTTRLKGENAIAKLSDEKMMALYQDVRKAVGQYSESKHLELVLQHDPETANTPKSIALRIQADACLPIYVAPGVDITKEIVAILKQK